MLYYVLVLVVKLYIRVICLKIVTYYSLELLEERKRDGLVCQVFHRIEIESYRYTTREQVLKWYYIKRSQEEWIYYELY